MQNYSILKRIACFTFALVISSIQVAIVKAEDPPENQALGALHGCAVTNAGGVKCWGYNGYGQLGVNDQTNRTVPTQLATLTSGINEVGLGQYHSCAITTGGGVKCWGYNPYGQIGNGSSGNNLLVPTDVSGLSSNVVSIEAGSAHTCALLSTAGVKCWGQNSYGEVGDNSGAMRTTPVTPTGLTSGVLQIASGSSHMCALLSTGRLSCWGSASDGQCGTGSGSSELKPRDAYLISGGLTAVGAGQAHTCVIDSSGGVSCWGRNDYGQIGNGSSGSSQIFQQNVTNLSSGAIQVDGGDSHTCALMANGTVKCWGRNTWGQLGNATNTGSAVPVNVSNLSGAIAISVAGNSSCALLNSGSVKCWGYNNNNQLGDGSGTSSNVPITTMDSGEALIPGFTVQSAPAGLDVVLASNWTANVETVGQSGVLTVGVQADTSRVAEMDIDFSSNINWSGVTAGSSTVSAFFHSTQPIATITNGESTSYALYVPKGEGNKLLICPGVDSLGEITLNCSDGYYLDETSANVEVVNVSSKDYWKVSGLTGTGGLSIIDGLFDTLSRLSLNATSNHTINFGTNYGLNQSGQTITITFDPNTHAFDLSQITLADILLTDGTDRTIAAAPGVNTWGCVINATADTITFTTPTSGTGYYGEAAHISVKIGTNVTGATHQIVNPATPDSYVIRLTLSNNAPGGGEEGLISIPIVDSDNVTVTGYVNTFINFDIDTAVADSDCTFSGCVVHGGVGANTGSNYTVDLGELNSTWKNQSNSSAVMHSDGISGVINSIWLDLTTNAYGGAIIYVSSLNSGLNGPASNVIASVINGSNIVANSGTYGFQLTDLPVGNGNIIRNSNCTIATAYCSLTGTANQVVNTNGRPLDDGRIRMDIAAAAAYINNPGNYTDTLTFTAVATY